MDATVLVLCRSGALGCRALMASACLTSGHCLMLSMRTTFKLSQEMLSNDWTCMVPTKQFISTKNQSFDSFWTLKYSQPSVCMGSTFAGLTNLRLKIFKYSKKGFIVADMCYMQLGLLSFSLHWTCADFCSCYYSLSHTVLQLSAQHLHCIRHYQ